MIAYFDYAATSFRKPRCVYKALKLYRKYGVSVGRGKNKHTNFCNNIIDHTRQMLKDLVKADNSYQTIFQPSATYALNLIIKGIDYKNIQNVYISKYEHNSVTRPLFDLQKVHKFNVIYLEDDYCCQFEKNKPDLVIMSHITNTFGIIQDFENVLKMAKKYKAITVLDMSQSFGLIETNITNANVDAAVFAGHKTLYGFSGIGGAVIKNSLKLNDTIQGGTGIESALQTMPKQRPIRFEPGTQNILGIFSLYYSCKYLLKLSYNNIKRIEQKNFNRLKQILSKHPILEIIEPKGKCSTIIACRIKNYSPENFAEYFSKNGIAIRTGLQCAPNAHKVFATFPSGTIRFSVGLFSKWYEFVKLNRVLKILEKKLRKS